MSGWIVRQVNPDTDEEEGLDPYPTRDEALTANLAGADPGDTVTVHQETCRSCSCTPDVLIVPPRRVA